MAWEAYKQGTIPIGAAILNTDDEIVSAERNQQYNEGDGIIKLHQIAHAEINAILNLSEVTDESVRKNIRTYTLYTTMEPCPLCFGAIVMGSIRNVKYAARDSYAGASALNNSIPYIKNKGIKVYGPYAELEFIQIAMQSCYELQRGSYADALLPSWKKIGDKGVLTGEDLFKNHILQDMAGNEFSEVYDFILKYIGGVKQWK